MTNPAPIDEPVHVRVLGGPTVLLEIGGLRLLTDPTFDAAGDYPFGPGRVLTKTKDATVTPAEIGRIDAVLLSHDEHPDNLDTSGRAFLAQVPLVLTTVSGATRLSGPARGMAPWETHQLVRPDGGILTITAAPALHGPEGSEPVMGEVIGFVLTGDDVPTVYISGDNASLDNVREVAERFDVDTAILFAGAVRASAFDDALATLDGTRAAEAAAILGARRVVPAHVDSWAHFTEGITEVVDAFSAAGLSDRLRLG